MPVPASAPGLAPTPRWLGAAPLLPCAVSFVVGVVIAPLLPLLPFSLPIVAFVMVMAAVILLRRQAPLPFLLMLFCLPMALAGSWRFQAAHGLAIDDVAHFNGRTLDLLGWVSEEPDVRDRLQLVRVTVLKVRRSPSSSWSTASGSLQLRVPSTRALEYGDEVEVQGRLEPPPVLKSFDYAGYLARQGIHSVLTYPRFQVLGSYAVDPFHAVAAGVRGAAEKAIARTLPEPEASLERAVLIGAHSADFSTLTPDFIRTGMIHILATSGFKVAIAGSLGIALAFPLLGRRRAIIPAVVLVAMYVVMTGSTPAGVRAALMWLLVAGALLTGRPDSSLQGLAVVAAGMVAWSPSVVSDSGFQMSVSATGGILLFAPRFTTLLRRWPGWVSEPVGMTLAAQIGALPVTMAGFSQVSLVAPLANLLCLPFLPLQMVLGVTLLLVERLSPAGGNLVGLVAFVPLAAMIAVVRVLAQIPGAAIAAPAFGAAVVILYYGACALSLVAWPLSRSGVKHPPASSRTAGLVLTLVVAALLAGFVVASRLLVPPVRLLAAVDTSGDRLLLKTPGTVVLIDTGGGAQPLQALVGEALLPWQRTLTAVVLLGQEVPHSGAALSLSHRFTVQQVVTSANPQAAAVNVRLTSLAARSFVVVPVGQVASLGFPGGTVRVWGIGPDRQEHLAALLTFAHLRILDVAALTLDQQRSLALSPGLPDVTLLIGAAPGGTPLAPALIRKVHPQRVLGGGVKASPSAATTGSVEVVSDGHGFEFR
ncbi:MAG: ComEC/Rec2 family competence protein [Chloroflexi bacterium]|nr:ComEC/Rec2 family competence protein [Chloroflexota bacterium]